MSDKAYKNYTLEKHLKLQAEEDQDYELLYSIWGLNKKNLTQGLNLVSSIYPHYSRHDIGHSMTIINNIQSLLGEERIRQLGATETFLILMACLTHDVGMILTYDIIEREWKKEGFKDTLSKFANSNDSVIANNAKVLLEVKNGKNINFDNFEWAVKVKNAVVILTSEILRNKHAQQGADNILSNEEFRRLADNYYSEQLSHRFLELLADVALLHGDNFDNVISRLPYKANGYKGDYIHPRFIACMVRLGDLLDFDDNRFNDFSIASIKEMPETSIVHKQKHRAVRHMLISPTKIEADLDCQDELVYRSARSWFDWLEDEVHNQCREWSNIAPVDLGGLPPIISKGSVKILYKGLEVRPELLNLKFTMPQRKIFNILQGGGIYKEPGLAFIREIVQNAFDASKIQMWNDINSGNYNITIGQDSFPDAIPLDVYKLYPVNLTIEWLTTDKDTIQVRCEDYGTGISEATLLRMTKYVGDSYQGDEGYAEMYNDMPSWLKPTAAFGIGLQSIFFVANTFEVETKYIGEKSKRIIFRSAADNQYCSIVEENIPRRRGTTIKVNIKKEKFSELFGSYFSMSVFESVDDLEHGSDDLYLAKIDDFVTNTFGSIKNLHFNYKTINSDHNIETKNNTTGKVESKVKGDYKYSCRYQDGALIFDLYEKKIGSLLSLTFGEKINIFSRRGHKLLLRDVLISNADIYAIETQYLTYEWNLNNQTTDSMVDLSRDNLTSEGRKYVREALIKTLLPDAIEFVYELFVKELKTNKNKSNSIETQYLNFYLTALACGKQQIIKKLPQEKFPIYVVSRNKKEVKIQDVFCAKSIFLVKGGMEIASGDFDPQWVDNILQKHKKILANNIIVWNDDYLDGALLPHFKCTEILVYDTDCRILKLEKVSTEDGKNNDRLLIKSCEDYLSTLDSVGFPKNVRKSIYGLQKYPIISVQEGTLLSMSAPPYSSCCIYSPFRNEEEINELLENVRNCESDSEVKELILSKLNTYITPNLMRAIKQNNVNKTVTEEDIKKDYVSLIYDYIKLTKTKK